MAFWVLEEEEEEEGEEGEEELIVGSVGLDSGGDEEEEGLREALMGKLM